MVSGIGRDLDRRIDAVAAERNSSHEAFLKLEATAKSRANKSKLDRLAKILGTTDQRVEPSGFEIITNPWNPGALATAGGLKAFAIRFESIPGVFGEGILLEPAEAPKASVVVLPDVAHSPEQQAGLSPGLPLQARLGFALAERGCRVVCLYLLDRESRYSANPEIQRFTNLPHREFLYRGSYEMGRTPVGYEAQKTMAAIDNLKLKDGKLPIVVVGHGEGGRIALYTGALDSRVSATWVSGAFGPRERMWQEPIDRNLWGILMEHGDAQVADLYGERALLIEASQAPAWTGPTPSNRGNQAAPGSINPISPDDASKEFSRSGRSKLSGNMADLVIPADGQPGASAAFARLAKHLNITFSQPTSAAWTFHSALPDPTSRQKRQISQMLDHVQKLWRASHRVRDAIWSAATRAGLDAWKDFTRNKRREFSTDVIGELPAPEIQPNPKSRAWKNGRNWKGHEVTLDLGPDVFAYGILQFCCPLPQTWEKGFDPARLLWSVDERWVRFEDPRVIAEAKINADSVRRKRQQQTRERVFRGESFRPTDEAFLGMPIRWIPPGRFKIGSPPLELGRSPEEVLHDVVISRGFFLAETECTQ
ncbi:MAG: hypothetical protein ACKO26_13865, partial [Planctomycetota bacterium]